MAEHKLFAGDEAYVSTYDFHEHRPRAKHLEDGTHRGRLELARDYVNYAYNLIRAQEGIVPAVSDLGCGDGGLLSILDPHIDAWGYDFCPANQRGWAERGIKGFPLDVVVGGQLNPSVMLGHITVMTEVLEHMTNPHAILKEISERKVRYLVCSSPFTENYESHDECHAWAWNVAGYSSMLLDAGWEPVNHSLTSMFQVVLRKNTRSIDG